MENCQSVFATGETREIGMYELFFTCIIVARRFDLLKPHVRFTSFRPKEVAVHLPKTHVVVGGLTNNIRIYAAAF